MREIKLRVTKLLKGFVCAIGIHHPSPTLTFDGCSFGAHCDWCDNEILQDSQGNWFPIRWEDE